MTSTTKPDYWSILGIKPGSDLTLIKSAFRSEARRWHPDLNINDINAEERFKLVNEAYAVLSDPKKRQSWESEFSVNSEELFSTSFPTYEEYIDVVLGIRNYIADDTNNVNNNNIQFDQDTYLEFEENEADSSHYSNHKPTTRADQPPPIKTEDNQETLIELTPEEALKGTTVEIELSNGSIIEFNTPPFAGDGWRLRLPRLISYNKDHFIQLRVQTNDGLRIDGLRVLYRLELFPHDALFGCAIQIPTLDGDVLLQVPPKSSSGRLLRLRGRGLNYNDLYGDQIVEIIIVLPADLTEPELALYKRLKELSYDDNN